MTPIQFAHLCGAAGAPNAVADEVQVLYINRTELTRTSVTPKHLLSHYKRRLTLRPGPEYVELLRSFANSADHTAFRSSKLGVDCRYCLLLLHGKQPVGSLFVGYGEWTVFLDGRTFQIHGPLSTWFRKLSHRLEADPKVVTQ